MVLFRRVLAVVGVLLATCGAGNAQTVPSGQLPNPGQAVPPSPPPRIVAGEPSLEYQDRLPRGWVSGGDPVGIPGEEGEIRDPRFYPPSGWFGTLDVGVLKPRVTQRISGVVAATGDTVQLPTAPLDWTGSPRVGLGYRFLNAGELVLTYQSVVSDGGAPFPTFSPAGDGTLRSRLNLNVVSLDWAGVENSFGPNWGMKWRAGVAYANVYFDSTATAADLFQRTSALVNGVGPHVGLELWRALPWSGWSLFGRLDGMYLALPSSQKEVEAIPQPDGSTVSGLERRNYVATPTEFAVDAGLSYTTPHLGVGRWVRFTAGYHFERWWSLGASSHSADMGLRLQGVIFRAEITY